jgi:hypothetical protein
MTVTAIWMVCGVAVTIEEYLEALGKTFDMKEYIKERDWMKEEDMDEDDKKEVIAEMKQELIDDLRFLNKGVLITSDTSSKVLTLHQLTHDIDQDQPLIIGINLGDVFDNERYLRNEVKSASRLKLADIVTAQETFQHELDTIKVINPKLYDLLAKKDIEIIMVQNDCYCCS